MKWGHFLFAAIVAVPGFAKDPSDEQALAAPSAIAPVHVEPTKLNAARDEAPTMPASVPSAAGALPTELLSDGSSFTVPGDMGITQDQLASLVASIKAGRVKNVSFEDHREIGDEQLALLADLTGLQVLNLKGTSVQTEGLQSLAGLSNLRELDLTDTAINSAGLDTIAQLKKLRILRLMHTRVDDAGVKTLASLTELRELNLCGTSITGQGLAALSSLLKLETLDLGETKVANGLEALRSLKKLENLHLNDTAVNDEALLPIQWLPGLRFLNISCTKITDKTLDRFTVKRGVQVLNACGNSK